MTENDELVEDTIEALKESNTEAAHCNYCLDSEASYLEEKIRVILDRYGY